MMGRFLNGMFIGAGIALLVTPKRGEDMRTLLRERFAALRASLPEHEQPTSLGKQATSQAQQTTENVRDLTQRSATQAQQTTESVRDLAQRSAKQAQPAGQGEGSSLKQGTPTRGPTTTPFPPATPHSLNPETPTNG